MFLRKVLFLSIVQAEVECCVVDRICSHDVCYVVDYPIVCLFRKVTAHPVNKCVRVGRPYGHPNSAMEKPMHLNSMMKSLFASF